MTYPDYSFPEISIRFAWGTEFNILEFAEALIVSSPSAYNARATRVEIPPALCQLAGVIFIADVSRVHDWAEEAGEPPFLILDIPVLKKGFRPCQHRRYGSEALGIAQEGTEISSASLTDQTRTRQRPWCSRLFRTSWFRIKTINNWATSSRYLLNFKGETLQHRIHEMFPIVNKTSKWDLRDVQRGYVQCSQWNNQTGKGWSTVDYPKQAAKSLK
ncbi:hypothetical protein PG984_014136 [Apiospora sp. TS-2023a]